MKPDNLNAINRSFQIQASNFESKSSNFTKASFLDYTISCVKPDSTDTFLEVASGTCVCGRSFAPLVQSVVCLDATVPMLEVGQLEAQRCQLHNITFVKGYAEELPFLDNSFSVVFSRLAFHHFTNVTAAFDEMVRVVNHGGKLVLIDMESACEENRITEDEIETLRDPSHVKNMSRSEMLDLYHSHNLSVEKCESTSIQQNLKSWLNLAKTPQNIQDEITERMSAEINGGAKTGFSTYLQNGEICFNQKWILLIGRKPRL